MFNRPKPSVLLSLDGCSYSLKQVNLVYVCGDKPLVLGGGLSDLMPTMLAILGVEQVAEMTGRSLN
jgi:2,3-bisphosphoglycerate-independent phosphoglycerate mutase